jgi:hypothetical protein
LGFPTGWLSTTHKDSLLPHQPPAANFLVLLPGIEEEEEAPTSTTLSHVNLAPSS